MSAVAAASAVLGAGAHGAGEWPCDLQAALKAARERGTVAVVFARTQWDMVSRWIERTVLSDPTMVEAVGSSPHCQAWLAHKKLRPLGLGGPTFLFFDSQGRLMKRTDALGPVGDLVREIAACQQRIGLYDRLKARAARPDAQIETLEDFAAELEHRGDAKALAATHARLAKACRNEAHGHEAAAQYWGAVQATREAARNRKGSKTDAVALWRKYVADHPNGKHSGRARLNLAAVLARKSQIEEAAKALEDFLVRADEDSSERPKTMAKLATLYEAAKQTEKAAAARVQLVRLYPRSPHALQMLVATGRNGWLVQGRPNIAVKACRQVLDVGQGPYAETGLLLMAAIENEGRLHKRMRRRRSVADVVCLAPDPSALLSALSRWDGETFFPVLLADEYFAPKFIKAFRPRRIVMLDPAAKFEVDFKTLLRVVSAAWGPEDLSQTHSAERADLRRRWADAGHVPLGAVIVKPSSPQALAAVALAAGHGQVLASVHVEGQPGGTIAFDDMQGLRRRVRGAIGQWGYSFDELRDDIDFVTVTAEMPYRYRRTDGIQPGVYAFDDALTRGADGRRFAYVGRLIGTPAQSVYAAMCSLFLQPDSALLFNTYGRRRGSIWKQYGMARAAKAVQAQERYSCRHVEGKEATLGTWHGLTRPESRFGLIFVNSSGGRTNWSIPGGGGTSDDVPLAAPALVEFTHSGSASLPTDAHSIAGRWLASGAFAYFGSSAEPYLSAFPTPSTYAARLLRGWPAGMAFRRVHGRPYWTPWRLVYLGDPLYSLHAPPPRRPAPSSIDGKDAAAEARRLAAAGGTSIDLVRLHLILNRPTDAIAVARKMKRGDMTEAQRRTLDFAMVLEPYQQGRYDDVTKYAGGLKGKRSTPVELLYRQSVLALWDKALESRDAKAALSLLDRVAQFAAHNALIARCVGQAVPICQGAEDRAKLREFGERMLGGRFKDKKSQSALKKALKKLGDGG